VCKQEQFRSQGAALRVRYACLEMALGIIPTSHFEEVRDVG